MKFLLHSNNGSSILLFLSFDYKRTKRTHVHAINNSLFMRVFTYNILIEESISLFARSYCQTY